MEKSQIKKRFTLWNFLFFGLGVLVLALLLVQINFNDLVDLILKIKMQYFLLAAGLYLCKGLVRAFRYTRIIEQNRIPFFKMVRLTFASSLASQVLPFKLGELTYVYLLKRENQTSVSQGLSSLLVIRLLDLLAVSLIFILTALAIPMTGNLIIFFQYILAFIGLLLAGIIFIIIISAKADFFQQIAESQFWISKSPVFKKGSDWILKFLFELKQYGWTQYLGWAILALMEWLVNFAVFHVLLYGFGFTPGLFDTITCVTFSVLASVLPINSLGNFGTQEVGWTAGLTLLGYTKEMAISSAFATHLITLVYFLIYGGLSWISYLFSHHDKQSR